MAAGSFSASAGASPEASAEAAGRAAAAGVVDTAAAGAGSERLKVSSRPPVPNPESGPRACMALSVSVPLAATVAGAWFAVPKSFQKKVTHIK